MEQKRRRCWLGLRSNVEKLAKGKITIEEYIMHSKTSLEDLILFAVKEHFPPDVIRELSKYKEEYKIYSKPFIKSQYLKTNSFIINGEMVKPTEQDVDVCIEYLKANGTLICDKNVRDTISKYKRGQLDITQRPGQVEEESTMTQLEILEEEQKELQSTLEKVEILEEEVEQAEKADKSIKIGD